MIVVIDDCEQILSLVRLTFKKHGLEAVFFTDGVTALEFIERNPVSLILVDIMMPVVDGFEFVKSLKRAMVNHKIPLVYMSSLNDVDSRISCYKLGAINFISKPLNLKELVAVVKSIKDQHKRKSSTDYFLLIEERTFVFKGHKIIFTPREFDIFRFIFKNLNQLVRLERVQAKIQEAGTRITIQSINTHLSSIRKKLRETDLRIEAVYGEGVKLSVANSSMAQEAS